MDPVISVRQLRSDDWQEWRAMRLAALAEAPDAFCSTLEEWSGEGDREDRWRARLEEVELNLFAEIDGRVGGMVSATGPVDGESELITMWVAPEERGKGVGDALVRAVLCWARRQGARRVALDVREGNRHALALYERQGFADSGEAPGPDEPFPELHLLAHLG